ncbi:phage integrase N-terminal SAM-like domain-containing protein [Allomeiothermus silvanus]
MCLIYTRLYRFHYRKPTHELGLEVVRAYLADLAVSRGVSASTQNLALTN